MVLKSLHGYPDPAPPLFFRKNGNIRFLSTRGNPAGSSTEHGNPPNIAKAIKDLSENTRTCVGEEIVKPGRQKGLLMEKAEI